MCWTGAEAFRDIPKGHAASGLPVAYQCSESVGFIHFMQNIQKTALDVVPLFGGRLKRWNLRSLRNTNSVKQFKVNGT